MAQPAYRPPMYPWPAPEASFTPEDLRELPSDGHRYEIIEGALHVAPPADIPHHEIADGLLILLRTSAPPGWRAVREIGIQIGDSLLVPDVTVLTAAAPREATWANQAHVALVVEVESHGSRRHDRFTKPALYAEAGIASFWRIERTAADPVAHLYYGPSGGHYRHHQAVSPEETVTVEHPYPLAVAPAGWLT